MFGKNKTAFFYPPVDPCDIAPVNLDRRGETEMSILRSGASYFARVTVMAVHLLDLDRVEVYEAGAALIALLAYPGPTEEEQREAAHAALCNHALRVKCEREPDWGRSPQSIKPLYALRRPVTRDLHTLRRRLRDRMVAGRMAIGFLQEAVTGRVPELPTTIPRVQSIRWLAWL